MNNYTYKIFDNGYDIYKDGERICSQRIPYANVYKKDGTYEENAVLQIETLVESDAAVSEAEKMRADLDYLALMTDVDLPSQEV